MEPLKKFSPAFYGVIILLFFLPFVNLSCSGQTIMSLSGFQLITGSEYKADSMFGQSTEGEVKENKEIESQPLALLALLAAVIALAVSFVKKRITAILNIVISICGGIFLLLLKFNLDSDAELNGQNIIQLEYQFAYWFSIVLFIATAVVQWKIFTDEGTAKANVMD